MTRFIRQEGIRPNEELSVAFKWMLYTTTSIREKPEVLVERPHNMTNISNDSQNLPFGGKEPGAVTSPKDKACRIKLFKQESEEDSNCVKEMVFKVNTTGSTKRNNEHLASVEIT